jgi:hypothetical protein
VITRLFLSLVVVLTPNLLHAQTSVHDVLSFLITTQSVPTANFVKDQQAAEATRETLARSLLVELTTVPLATSSGGFSYRINRSLGTLQRVTQGFGPFFVDRGTTAGRGWASMSVTYRHSEFTKLDARHLQDGSLVTTSNKFRDEPSAFDVETLTLNIQTSNITVFANYGVTDWLDLGVAVPVVRLNIAGERANTYRGATFIQARGQANSIGLADVPLRSKVQLARGSSWQLATDLEVVLPTGDPENLRGSGRSAIKGAVVASAGGGWLEGHVNAGFVEGGVSDQIVVGGALAATVRDRVTLSAETLVRRITGLGRIRDVAEPHPLFSGVDTIRLVPTNEAITGVTLVAGMRWNITSTWLVNSYVLLPMTSSGLAARPIPALSIDYSFVP